MNIWKEFNRKGDYKMGSLKNEYKSFLDDIEKNIKDKEDLNLKKDTIVENDKNKNDKKRLDKSTKVCYNEVTSQTTINKWIGNAKRKESNNGCSKI